MKWSFSTSRVCRIDKSAMSNEQLDNSFRFRVSKWSDSRGILDRVETTCSVRDVDDAGDFRVGEHRFDLLHVLVFDGK